MSKLIQNNLFMNILISVVSIVIGFVGGFLTNKYYYSKGLFYTHQIIPREIPRVEGFPAVVFSGTSAFILIPGTRIKLSNVSPYTVEVKKDGNLLLNGDLYDYRGFVVALLRDSSLRLSPGIDYDINADLEAIEVVNEKGQPVLQIWKPTDHEVELIKKKRQEIETDWINHGMPTDQLTLVLDALSKHEVLMTNYVSYLPSKTDNKTVQVEIADSQGTITTGNIGSVTQRIGGIKRIFEYPGDKKPGMRRRNQ